ncbi:FAD-dependent oxidoreductase [Magnetococcus sp. PR-3]|uniref:FAD-dependent oxidoreductase n=1 Tax=Magnetococcus sp. PR-3 TaxID=3120355 RepID=UPI002FCE4810
MSTVVIIGGGPSGLAAAQEVQKRGGQPVVLERLDIPGGLSRTLRHDDCRYDIGPHRFFTRNQEVHQLFVDMGGDSIIHVPRLTRIFYGDTFFNYPLTAMNALTGMNPTKSAHIMLSYAYARIKDRVSPQEIKTFEDWVVNRFGRGLFETFFKTYTEKVWGIGCEEIGADWAAQRIKGLNLLTVIKNALFQNAQKGQVKTLVDEFIYPRLGAGQVYENMADHVSHHGGGVHLQHTTKRIIRDGFKVKALVCDTPDGEQEIAGDFFLSSAPLTEMLAMFSPEPPPEVLQAAQSLAYRNHIGVNLKVEGQLFKDNWIYIHDSRVAMARIANYRNFSPDMSPRAEINPLTVEYFCFSHDAVWQQDDRRLIELATEEMVRIGLIKPNQVVDGFVQRNAKAYPVIRKGYQDHIDTIRSWLGQMENLVPIGRSGMFKYNNQDHAMMTGLIGARIAMGEKQLDPWNVNIDAEYHEGGEAH